MKAFVCALLFLSVVILLCCHSYVEASELQPEIAASRHLLGIKSSCLGCVSYPRNVPNFRTRSRHQVAPLHQDALYLTGRRMLQSKEPLVDSSSNEFQQHSPSPLKSAVVHQIDHPDRYVPGGPDPLHHRSTPPSMIPDLN